MLVGVAARGPQDEEEGGEGAHRHNQHHQQRRARWQAHGGEGGKGTGACNGTGVWPHKDALRIPPSDTVWK